MTPRWTLVLEGGPRRVNHSAVIIDHNIFMFGGHCKEPEYKLEHTIDIHILNACTYRWRKIPSEKTYDHDSQVPYMRYGHATVAVDKKVYLFGGRSEMEVACRDLFCFDTMNFKWMKLAVSGDGPTARDGHAMCVVNDNIYLFGGFEGEARKFSDELFILDLSKMAWQRIQTGFGGSLCWRDFHTMTSSGDRIYIFGGRGSETQYYSQFGDIYDNCLKVFNTKTSQWSEPVKASSPLPDGRRSHSAFMYKNCLYIFGGFNSQLDEHFNDLWKYDPNSKMWQQVRTFGRSPVPRRRQCCCIFKDNLFMFGGTSPASDRAQIGYTDDELLFDHNDTNILDFSPTLKTLCFLVLLSDKVDFSQLPPPLRWEASMMTTPNNITRSLLRG